MATVAGVASSPIRPVRLATTASWAAGPQDADHVDLGRDRREMLLERLERCGARRVAGDDEHLRALLEQMVGDRQRERAQLRVGPVAVREVDGVAEVQVVLGGERDEQLVQHGEAADARVEHPDRGVPPGGRC